MSEQQPETQPRTLGRAFDLNSDDGSPVALLESLQRSGALHILESVDEDDVLVEFPFGAPLRDATGCSRFLRLRNLSWALVVRKRQG